MAVRGIFWKLQQGGWEQYEVLVNDARRDAISAGYLGRIQSNAERMAGKVIGTLLEAPPQRRAEAVIQTGMRANAKHDGSVRAEGRVDFGATFYFTRLV